MCRRTVASLISKIKKVITTITDGLLKINFFSFVSEFHGMFSLSKDQMSNKNWGFHASVDTGWQGLHL